MHKLPQAEGQVRSALGIPIHIHYHGVGDMSGGGFDWNGLGRSIAGALHIPTDESGAKDLAKRVISVALPSAGAAVGGAAGSFAGPIGSVVGGTFGGIGGRVGAEQANKSIGSGLGRKRGRPSKKMMQGSGWLSGLLDTPMTPRQIIKFTGNVPGLVKEGAADVRGGSLMDTMKKVSHGGVMELMGGSGVGGKGSEAMRLKMQKLRAMRKSNK